MGKRPLWVYITGSFLCVGCVPRMRGTAGTAAAALLIWAVEKLAFDRTGEFLPWWWTPLAAASVFIAALPVATLAVRHWGEDPQWFVLDEVVGWITVQ